METALTFLKKCVKEAGWAASSRVGLRGENNNLAWNSVYPRQRVECVKSEPTPTSPVVALTLSFLSPSLLTEIIILTSPKEFYSKLNHTLLCGKKQWEGAGCVSSKKNNFSLY